MSWWQTLLVTVVPSLGTLWISQRHARNVSADEREDAAATARNDRHFRARESRYADRREALVALIAEAQRETSSAASFQHEHGVPAAALHEDYSFSQLNDAHARLAVVASSDVAEAGTALRSAVMACFQGESSSWDDYDSALAQLQRLGRIMLAESYGDAETPLS